MSTKIKYHCDVNNCERHSDDENTMVSITVNDFISRKNEVVSHNKHMCRLCYNTIFR